MAVSRGKRPNCIKPLKPSGEHGAKGGGQGAEAMEHDAFREGSYAKGDAHDGGGDDADKDGALDLIGHEHGGNQKADQGHDGGVVASHGGKVRHIGRGAHHDARIQKADECR